MKDRKMTKMMILKDARVKKKMNLQLQARMQCKLLRKQMLARRERFLKYLNRMLSQLLQD